MSTFTGYVQEFPDLGIDYFRPRAAGLPCAKAYLLSHTHTDHLQGLECKTFGGAFIYCSSTTKKMLLMTQDVQSRTKAARGQCDRPTYKYRHLVTQRQDLLRVLEYDTPTPIEVGAETLYVTMFDANHCPGSSMFLIEGPGRAVLYTGDMRAEPSFLQEFLRNPVMLPYTTGRRRLDCIYLDTSARINGPPYPSKLDACRGLIHAIALYPASTSFYLNARCTGYEDLWIAINRAFHVRIHVDRYRETLYKNAARDWKYGRVVDELLTCDSSNTRIHSCESIDPCIHRPAEQDEVYIKIVNHLPSTEAGTCPPSLEHRLDYTHLKHSKSMGDLPKVLLVPFARHSSYPELVAFVSALQPKKVHSCTGDVGHFFNSFCHPTQQDDTFKVRQYQDLVTRGMWHESSRCRRQALMQDVVL